jgi:phosphoglycolate phosphatase-like HAD superfamily hydrolase
MNLIQAAIFDMDGLMLDTEQLGLATFRKVIAELGYSALDHVYLRTVGRNSADTQMNSGSCSFIPQCDKGVHGSASARGNVTGDRTD